MAKQLLANGASGPASAVVPEQAGTRSSAWKVVRRADGTMLSMWARGSMVGATSIALNATLLAPDGTRRGGDTAPIEAIPISSGLRLDDLMLASGGPTTVFAYAQKPAAEPSRLRTALLDASPPQLDVSGPATVERGAPAAFSATASDPAGVTAIEWQFGDGSGATASGPSASHVYTGSGRYTVTATAIDGFGERAVVTRTVVVTDPVAPPGPPAPPGPAPPGPPARAERRPG